MKIVIIQGAFFPVPALLGGAVEKMWYALGRQFAVDGHQVVHISRQYKELPVEEQVEGVLYKRIEGYNTPSSGVYLKLLDLIYSYRAIKVVPKDADVIITNTFWSPILIGKKQKIKCYVDVARMPKGQMKLYKSVGRLRANSTPVAIAIRQELEKKYYSKIVMIPNPIPFVPESGVWSSEKQSTVLYTGRIHPEKGLDILIKGWHLSGLGNRGWNLEIVGPWQTSAGGGGDIYLEELKEIAGEESTITFVGPIYDTSLLNQYYKAAALFVYPSVAEKGETFGIAPLEAMAWGCVPIVSSLECFQDFIKQGWNGFIFNHRQVTPEKELADYLTQLANNSGIRKEMSDNSLQVRQTHSLNNIASQFIADFERLITN